MQRSIRNPEEALGLREQERRHIPGWEGNTISCLGKRPHRRGSVSFSQNKHSSEPPLETPPQTLTVRAPPCSIRIGLINSVRKPSSGLPNPKEHSLPAGRAGTRGRRRAEPCAGTLGIPECIHNSCKTCKVSKGYLILYMVKFRQRELKHVVLRCAERW